MKATVFSRVPYLGSAPGGVWPVPPAAFSPEPAEQPMVADLNFLPVSRDKILRSIELFGTKVLPRIREL